MEELQPDSSNGQLRRFALDLKRQVVGQDEALDKLVDSLSRMLAGIQDPERPLLTMLFMGPTGVGKTETIRALARILFGHPRAFTRVNCQEYSAHFNLSKLLGSPPGYVGGEIKPIVCQENLDRHHTTALERGTGLVSEPDSLIRQVLGARKATAGSSKLALVLFDEVEKAHPKLWDLLLGVLEEGTLTLANNEDADFRNAIIILTTNVGSEAIGAKLGGETIGFAPGTDAEGMVRNVADAAQRAARKVFPLEFLNRFDEIVAYRPLGDDELVRILDLMVTDFHRRSLTCARPFLVQLSGRARLYLIGHEADPALGARPLRRALDQLVVTPLSHLVVQKKLSAGDLVLIDADEDGLRFLRHPADEPEAWPAGSQGPPQVRWVSARVGQTDNGGEQEDITEDVRKIAAQAGAAGAAAADGSPDP